MSLKMLVRQKPCLCLVERPLEWITGGEWRPTSLMMSTCDVTGRKNLWRHHMASLRGQWWAGPGGSATPDVQKASVGVEQCKWLRTSWVPLRLHLVMSCRKSGAQFFSLMLYQVCSRHLPSRVKEWHAAKLFFTTASQKIYTNRHCPSVAAWLC